MSLIQLFDAHFHIIDNNFPLIPSHGYLPDEFRVSDYKTKTEDLKISGGAVVSGSFQGFDQDYLISALNKLGSDYVGVTQLPVNTPDEELLQLNDLGVRAVRFNVERGGSEKLENLEHLALRVNELAGWHTELYIDSSKLKSLYFLLKDLPAVSIDHLGLSKLGFETLLKLVESGVKVKATGFGRVDFDVKTALKEIVSVNPNALMFGTDLPSTRAKRPFRVEDLNLIKESFDKEVCNKIFYENALDFYKAEI